METSAATTTMASIISNVGEVFTAVLGWAGTVGETIVSTPLLLFGVTLGFIGVGVSLFRRMLNI